jgi:two-component system, OmpR family, phosphate regulon response regulator PhoB
MSCLGASPLRILVVDDEAMVRGLLNRLLTMEGYEVLEVEDGHAALEQVRTDPPDLILLDLMLPGRDGLDILGDLRRTTDVPVILLTARGEEADRVVGLKLGADDYVVKPFSAAELSARVQSVLRRSHPAAAPAPPPEASPPAARGGRCLAFDGLQINLDTREVSVKGEAVETTAREFDLLAFLAASPRQVFSRQQLLEHVWDSSPDWQSEATVTEHVRRLRRKIEDDPDQPRWVTTARGVGYRFEP